MHPSAIGRRIEIVGTLQRLQVFCDGRLVADHERAGAKHQTISAPEHVTAADALRRERLAVLRPAPEPEVEQRDLSDYDTIFGIGDGGHDDARPVDLEDLGGVA